MKRPLLVLALSWACGILLADLLPFAFSAALLSFLFLLLLVENHRVSDQSTRRSKTLLLCTAGILVGLLRTEAADLHHRTRLQAASLVPSPYRTFLRGPVETPFVPANRTWKAVLDSPYLWNEDRWLHLSGRVTVYSSQEAEKSLEAGDILTATGTWRLAAARTLPGEPDWERYRQTSGVVGSLFAQSHQGIGSIPAEEIGWKFRILRIRDRWRARVRDVIVSGLARDRASLVLAMVTGEREGMSPALEQSLVETGLYHLTSISGLHITALILAFPWFLKLVGVRKRWRPVAGIPLALAFLVLVGFQVPVVRATLMGVALMLAILIDRPSQSLNLLGAAALAILIPWPSQLFLPGFQLSFLVVAGLILAFQPGQEGSRTPRFERFFPVWLPPPGLFATLILNALSWLASGLLASLVAVIVSAPITAYHFHQVSWHGILGNLAGVPLATAITLLGGVLVFFEGVGLAVGNLILPLLDGVSGWLIQWTQWIQRLPFGFDRVVRPNPVEAVLLFALYLVILLPPGWKRTSLLSRRTLCLGVLAGLLWTPLWGRARTLDLHFLDVGQGDCCLIRFPAGETMLVDTGPPEGKGPERTLRLADALRALRVRSLNAILISHPELDHLGNLDRLLEEYRVGALFCSGDTNETDEFRKVAKRLESLNIPLYKTVAGDRLEGFSSALIEILHPSKEEIASRIGTRNDRSIVFRLDCLGTRVLFPGDIGEEAEVRMVEREADLEATVLKVPHHGSASSSSLPFLGVVRPAISVVCVGENRFGHPDAGVLARLALVGSTTYTTLENGTVTLSWNGRSWTVRSWKDERLIASLPVSPKS